MPRRHLLPLLAGAVCALLVLAVAAFAARRTHAPRPSGRPVSEICPASGCATLPRCVRRRGRPRVVPCAPLSPRQRSRPRVVIETRPTFLP